MRVWWENLLHYHSLRLNTNLLHLWKLYILTFGIQHLHPLIVWNILLFLWMNLLVIIGFVFDKIVVTYHLSFITFLLLLKSNLTHLSRLSTPILVVNTKNSTIIFFIMALFIVYTWPKICHVGNNGLTFLVHSGVLLQYWRFVFDTTVSLINLLPLKALAHHSPYSCIEISSKLLFSSDIWLCYLSITSSL